MLWVVGAAGSRATKEGVDGLREEPTEEDLRIRKMKECMCLKGLLPPAEFLRLEAEEVEVGRTCTATARPVAAGTGGAADAPTLGKRAPPSGRTRSTEQVQGEGEAGP